MREEALDVSPERKIKLANGAFITVLVAVTLASWRAATTFTELSRDVREAIRASDNANTAATDLRHDVRELQRDRCTCRDAHRVFPGDPGK